MSPEILRYHTPQDQIQALKKTYREALELVRLPHCLGFEFSQSRKDPGTFLLEREHYDALADRRRE